MTTTLVDPVLYLKKACPFCVKLRIFLTEAGLYDKVRIREFAPETDEEQAIRAELAPHLEKLSFPTARTAQGQYLTESDAIIDHYAREAGVDPSNMPTLRAYTDDLMPVIRKVYLENMDLKKRLP